MKKIFMQRIYPDGYTWKNVPDEYMESYFEEFKKFYKWDESIDIQVHQAFLAQVDILYTYMVSKFKAERTSNRRPFCLPKETWRIWEAYWDRPDVKAKCEQQRKNMMSEKFYKWDESIDQQVHQAFLAQAGIHYTYMVSKFKVKRTSNEMPSCLPEETWAFGRHIGICLR
ncbi:PREDICTED: uncharacterized protein LOC109192716 [Ipomoea nil]|uniref:uncharacterized protein LOC109192716 n=1 Tax=Ipomoea nil TaxID=35883 RepID=UPI000900FD87|nr:PREDICTED: uncharacterized protein LOC109192716 [Ipomoea nil]